MLPLHRRQLLKSRPHCVGGPIVKLSWALKLKLGRSQSTIVRGGSRASLGWAPDVGRSEIIVVEAVDSRIGRGE